jgi:uncharacterized protein (TIGR03083 family)
MDGSFAFWVQPVATALAEDRRALLAFARSARVEDWDQPSALEGWTRKDILAHLAGGNDQLLQIVLRGVTSHTAIDPALLDPDTDVENARRVAERRTWTIDELIAELERDGHETQALLSKLRPEDEGLQQPGSPLTLGQFLEIVRLERHDAEHLAQMRIEAS